jgi:hypothetical protein
MLACRLVAMSGLVSLTVLLGCWADFPDSRFNQDASPGDTVQVETQTGDLPLQPDVELTDGPATDGPVTDGPVTDGPVTDGPVPVVDGPVTDGPVMDGPVTDTLLIVDTTPADLPQTDAFCVPNSFIQCSQKILVKCNSAGDGTVDINCNPDSCDQALGRCDACDPSDPPTCQGGAVVTCDADGLEVSTPCPAGCQNAQCCNDADQDTYSDCDGDCNESDPLVNPGQTVYQTQASNGSFDYNCDNQVDPEYPDPVNCVFTGAGCSGSGWVGTPPNCGDPGSFALCIKQTGSCIQQLESRQQGCL